MTTTKLAMACGSVLLAAGLTLGVGWVASGAGAVEDAPVTNVAPAQTPAQPAKPEENKAVKPVDRLQRLQKQSEEIADRIQLLHKRAEQEAPEADRGVDISVLQAELYDLEKKILTAENQQKIDARALERALKAQEAGLKQGVTESLIDERLERVFEVIDAQSALQKANLVLESVTPRVAVESPVLAAAKKAVTDATAVLDAARNKARPTAERDARAAIDAQFAGKVTVAKEQVEADMDQLKDYLKSRERLATRLAEAKRGESKRQAAQDELRVLREIQMELLRHRTLAELGVEGLPLPAARSEVSGKVEGELRSLRQQVEELQREVEALRKKK